VQTTLHIATCTIAESMPVSVKLEVQRLLEQTAVIEEQALLQQEENVLRNVLQERALL
jgi:hypothetical protein